jgi:hypothetical protein
MRGGAAPLDPGSLLSCASLGRWSGSAGYQKHASCCLDSGRAVGKYLLFYVGIALGSSGSNRASSHSVSFRPGVATQHMLEGVEVSKCVGRRSSDSSSSFYIQEAVCLSVWSELSDIGRDTVLSWSGLSQLCWGAPPVVDWRGLFSPPPSASAQLPPTSADRCLASIVSKLMSQAGATTAVHGSPANEMCDTHPEIIQC